MVSCAPFRNQVKEQGVGGEKWAETKNVAVPKILRKINAFFFFVHSIINQELLPEGQTINAVYYTDFQEWLVKGMN
jgi:hypothetical protein